MANRLQRALMQEASSTVAAGVCDWMDVELAVTKGPGFRWPIQGPVRHRHLGWRGNPDTKDSFIDTVERRWGATPMEELEDWHDENMLALLRELKEAPG